MPPKGIPKAPSCLGAVATHKDGWRVRATIEGRTVNGPVRLQKRDADADLAQARSAQTQDEYSSILKQMRESAQSSSGDAHPVARTVSEALPVAPTPTLSGNEREELTTQEQSQSSGVSQAVATLAPEPSAIGVLPSNTSDDDVFGTGDDATFFAMIDKNIKGGNCSWQPRLD